MEQGDIFIRRYITKRLWLLTKITHPHFTHSAIYIGNNKIIEAGGQEKDRADDIRIVDINKSDWLQNDIDEIENMVTGDSPKRKGSQSFLNLGVTEAYADEGLSSDVQAAALRRKERRADLVALEEQGILGENKMGLVEVRKAGAKIAFPVDAENSDRMIIYRAVAEKNGSSVEEVQKLYAKRLQADAASGTPIEVDSGWTIKH